MGRVKEGRGTFLANAAEHYVVAELLRRDVLAAQAPRNAPGIDVLATAGPRAVNVRVKGRSDEAKDWQWRTKPEGTLFKNVSREGDFTVLVYVPGGGDPPRFWVVPTTKLDGELRRRFDEWVKTPGRGGRPHNPASRMRRFGAKEGEQRWLEPFAGRWDLILAALGREGREGTRGTT